MSVKRGFAYIKTPFRYRAHWSHHNPRWKGSLEEGSDQITLSQAATVFHYSQTCFEGLKAFKNAETNRLTIFRPDQNAERMAQSAKRLAIPPIPKSIFIEAVSKVASSNSDIVPTTKGEAFYLRPVLFGSGAKGSVGPSDEYQFIVFGFPVGNYFSTKTVNLVTTSFDRAAPNGIGHVKAGGNYAAGLLPQSLAVEAGFSGCLYLDPVKKKFIEEAGAANFIAVTKDNRLITPKSSTILPGITRQSLFYLAENYLGMKTEEREIDIDELSEVKECAFCGTAAVLTTVDSVTHNDGHPELEKVFTFPDEPKQLQRLKSLLLDIQRGDEKGPESWVLEVEPAK